MMITDTEMTNWIIEKFSGSGGIRTHDLRVTSPLLYQLRYRALGAVHEWIPIYMAHVIAVTLCKLTISPGWSQCFDSILEPSSVSVIIIVSILVTRHHCMLAASTSTCAKVRLVWVWRQNDILYHILNIARFDTCQYIHSDGILLLLYS